MSQSHILRSGVEYNPAVYKGGHRVYLCQFATVLTYKTVDNSFKFIIEFYDDNDRCFAIKRSEVVYAAESSALDQATWLVGWYDQKVGA